MYDGSAIIGRTKYRRNIGESSHITMRVYSNGMIQTKFHRTYQGDEKCFYAADSNNKAIASMLEPTSRSAKFLKPEDLMANETKMILTQIEKNLVFIVLRWIYICLLLQL